VISRGSRRSVRSAFGFDTLEDRRLLSHSWGPMSAGWQPSGGHGDGPAPAIAMLSNRSPGPFGGSSNTWVQGQSFSSIGTIAARPATDVPSNYSAIIVALGAEPWAPNSSAPEVSGDQIGALLPGAGPSSAQSVSVFISLDSSAAGSGPPWVIASSPFLPALRIAAEPVVVPGNMESHSGPAAIAVAKLPDPQGADLITELAAFRFGQIEQGLSRLLGVFREPFEHEDSGYFYVHWIVLAIAALEAARRWRRQMTQRPRYSRRLRSCVINSLLSMLL
jgi:hypothetical protein